LYLNQECETRKNFNFEDITASINLLKFFKLKNKDYNYKRKFNQ